MSHTLVLMTEGDEGKGESECEEEWEQIINGEGEEEGHRSDHGRVPTVKGKCQAYLGEDVMVQGEELDMGVIRNE